MFYIILLYPEIRFKRVPQFHTVFKPPSRGLYAGLHKLWYPGIRDRSTWSKFGAHGEHGDAFLFFNLGAL